MMQTIDEVLAAAAKPKRIQLQRTKGWRKPASAIVIARPSIWGNPFRVGDCATVNAPRGNSADITITPAIAVDCYRDLMYLRLMVIDDENPEDTEYWQEWHDNLEILRGRDLACWCALDQPCHADVLLELADKDGTHVEKQELTS